MGSLMLDIKAITFDDFFTLRYPTKEKEDVIYPILRALKMEGVYVDAEEFRRRYFREDELYRKRLKQTLRESLLDDIVTSVLASCGYRSETAREVVRKAVDYGLATRKAKWFPNVKRTLTTLRNRGYELGLISNTHWRVSQKLRGEFDGLFDVITVSYEHGYAKPHPSIFVVTLDKLGINEHQCLHVGDDPIADVQGAHEVGMKTAFIRRGEVSVNADLEIKRITELATLF
jgi:putative hydrolase of the HAD superfamily